MITLLSKRITDYLFKKEIISAEEKEVCRYGYELLIADIVNLLMIAIIGIVLNRIIITLIFYLTFNISRKYCGGYHAQSYGKCRAGFLAVYLFVLGIAHLLAMQTEVQLLVVITILYFVATIGYAPVENKNKPIEDKDKMKFKLISVAIGGIFLVASIILFYFSQNEMALVVALTLFSTAMLMVIDRFLKEEELK